MTALTPVCVDAALVGPGGAASGGRVARHDGPTLAQLHRRHRRRVAALAWRLLGNADDVDDVVQETFLVAAERRASRCGATSERAWLSRIAAKCVGRLLATRRRALRLADDLAATLTRHADPRPLHALISLVAAIESMPDELRTPWMMHRLEGYALPEVAARTHMSVAMLRRRVNEVERRLGLRARARTIRAD